MRACDSCAESKRMYLRSRTAKRVETHGMQAIERDATHGESCCEENGEEDRRQEETSQEGRCQEDSAQGRREEGCAQRRGEEGRREEGAREEEGAGEKGRCEEVRRQASSGEAQKGRPDGPSIVVRAPARGLTGPVRSDASGDQAAAP